MGGALATLAVLDLSMKGYYVENLFTYGLNDDFYDYSEPRMGNLEF